MKNKTDIELHEMIIVVSVIAGIILSALLLIGKTITG